VDKLTWNDTIPFVAPIKGGHVIKVYDGDTITIASILPYKESPIFRFSVRLAGIDSPEIRGKSDHEKKIAQDSKHALETLLLNRTIILKNIKNEKYGRILADVYLDNLHVNKWMLDNNYAVKYDGGKKQSWD